LLRAFAATRLHGISSIHQYQSLYTRLDEGSKYISLISGLIPNGGNTLTRLSSTETAALADTFDKVPFLRKKIPQSLTSLVFRLCLPYLPQRGTISGQTCASDFIPTPSSVNLESSPTWNCVTNPQITLPLGSPIFGRGIVTES